MFYWYPDLKWKKWRYSLLFFFFSIIFILLLLILTQIFQHHSTSLNVKNNLWSKWRGYYQQSFPLPCKHQKLQLNRWWWLITGPTFRMQPVNQNVRPHTRALYMHLHKRSGQSHLPLSTLTEWGHFLIKVPPLSVSVKETQWDPGKQRWLCSEGPRRCLAFTMKGKASKFLASVFPTVS